MRTCSKPITHFQDTVIVGQDLMEIREELQDRVDGAAGELIIDDRQRHLPAGK